MQIKKVNEIPPKRTGAVLKYVSEWRAIRIMRSFEIISFIYASKAEAQSARIALYTRCKRLSQKFTIAMRENTIYVKRFAPKQEEEK